MSEHALQVVTLASAGNGNGGGGAVMHSPHELLFANRSVSVILLLLCFCWALLATLLPTISMRHEQFTRRQVVALSVWHAFAAGVLLSAAWMLFLPNLLFTSENMRLALPALPFMLLFLALLVPLALDRLMLWLSSTRKAAVIAEEGGGGGIWTGGITPSGEESAPSTPRRVAGTPQPLSASSRKGSSAFVPPFGPGGTGGGYQADSLAAEERKGSLARTSRSSSMLQGSGTRGPGLTAMLAAQQQAAALAAAGAGGYGEESQPLTGNDIESGPLLTPKGTPKGPLGSARGVDPSATPTRGGGGWYGAAAMRSVDASQFKAHQSYIARCALCKENITTGKGVAYHGAGCPLRSFHAFSFSSRWMQGLRGRRSLQKDIIMYEEGGSGGAGGELAGPPTAVGWSLLCYVVVLSVYNLCLAGSVNLQEAARLYSHASAMDASMDSQAHLSWIGEIGRVCLVALVMFCFTGFYGFSLGMMLALHRVSLATPRALAAILCYALSLPGAIAINYALSSYVSEGGARAYAYYLLVCQAFCVGILIYAAFLDLLLEEWARADAMWGKNVGFALGAGIVIAVAMWAPM